MYETDFVKAKRLLKEDGAFTIAKVNSDSKYDDKVELISTDGRSLVFSVEGDCCSNSYFTPQAFEDFNSIVGDILVDFEEVDSSGMVATEEELRAADCLAIYCLKLTTNKQSLSIDWRNDSNGYYGGMIYAHYNAAKKE